jgi:AraC-like DNA-binding protein
MDDGWFLELFMERIPMKETHITVGRDQDCLLPLATGGVSRNHANITWSAQYAQWIVEDNNSTNGTFVNGKRIIRKTPLNHGDMIYFGNVEVRLCYDPLSVSANVPRNKTSTDAINIKPLMGDTISDKIERAIEQNIQKGLYSTRDLADTLAIDRSTLFRQIKQNFEQSPSSLLMEKRLEVARELLRESENVSEVAFSTGFESLAHFSRSFKKKYGDSPSKFLKQGRK